MNNTSPFPFLDAIAARFQPPAWVVDEGQQRMVLFLNHVLLQERQAQERLLHQKGRVVHLRWGVFAFDLVVTPAGLVDRAPALSTPDLVLTVAAESPLAVVQSMLAGKTPSVKIEGNVQLAADIGWLADNLRWDAEEDLSRLIGDAPAHALADVGRRVASSLQQFLAKTPLPATMQAEMPAATSFTPTSPMGGARKTASVVPLPQAPQTISPESEFSASEQVSARGMPAVQPVSLEVANDARGLDGEVLTPPPGAAA